MSLVALSNIHKMFEARVIFEGLNFNVYEQERVGLIGDNGTGKTTLFKIIMGHVVPESGDVAVGKSVRVGHLQQDPVFDADNSVLDEAELAFADLHKLSHRLREIEHEMEGLEGESLEKVLRKYQQVQHEFELAGGYAWRHRLEATLLGVGLDRATWGQNVTTLSGGQKSRLALAKLLIAEPDVLLLDEPTNHLDLSAIAWLEKYLADFKGSVVLISHDRYLLDRLATRIVWLTGTRLKSYPGNYSAFVQQRAMQDLTQERQFEKQQAYIEKQAEFVRRFKAGQRSKEAKGREKRLNRLLKSDAMVQQVGKSRSVHLSLGTDQRAGDQVLDVRGIAKTYGEKKLWSEIAFHVRRGERIGMIGPNGSGKTTMLRVLLGEVESDDGDIKWGANLNIGYYDQKLGDFDPEGSVFDETREDREVKDQEVRNVLAAMLFRGDDVEKPMKVLSGGERARVALARLLLDRPNVLIMDEPTNHLDIASREALEGSLQQFEGTILCASHDRYFLEKTMGRLLVVKPDGFDDFAGKYSTWVAKQQTETLNPKSEARISKQIQNPKSKIQNAPKKDNPYLRPFGRLSVQDLEKQIARTEQEVKNYEAMFADPATFRDPQKGKTLQDEYEQACKILEQLEDEYFMREG